MAVARVQENGSLFVVCVLPSATATDPSKVNHSKQHYN